MCHVLIIDDEPSDREVLAAVLWVPSRSPYEFHFAPDGERGLRIAAALAEAAHGDTAAVICCDLVMPEMNGLEFCVRLRADPATRALPLLAVTGLDAPEIWADLLDAGADGIVLKPYDPREVRNRVGALAREGRGS